MPYSSSVFDAVITKIIKFLKPDSLLDLGAGAGKYGLIAKKSDPAIQTVAVEIEKDYIKKFNLALIYDKVWNISATEIIKPHFFDFKFDIVVAGDLLEHLKKSEGINLLNYLIYRCKWIIVQFPDRYLQGSVNGYHSEAHISVWLENDFYSFERTRLLKNGVQNLIILRGYLENKISMKQIIPLLKRHANKKKNWSLHNGT